MSEHLYAEATFDEDGPMRVYITKHRLPPLPQDVVAAVQSPDGVSHSSRDAGSSAKRVYVVQQTRTSFKGEDEQLERAELADSCAYANLLEANEAARTLWLEEKADEEHEKEKEEDEENAGSDAACYSGSVRVWEDDNDNGRVCAISVQELAIRKRQASGRQRQTPKMKVENPRRQARQKAGSEGNR